MKQFGRSFFALSACLALGSGHAVASTQVLDASRSHEVAVSHMVEAINYPATISNAARNVLAQLKAPINEDDAKFQMIEGRVASASPEQLAPCIVDAFSGHISTEDANAVADMFESAAGRKIIGVALQNVMKPGTDFSALVGRAGMTDAEKASFAQFIRTPAWQHFSQMATDPQVAKALLFNIVRSDLFTPDERKDLLARMAAPGR